MSTPEFDRHFVTGDFRSRASFLPDDVYGQALDSLVVTCCDAFIVCQGKVLLGKRSREPQPDWWVIGGRMKPGESFQEAACRNVERELQLRMPPHDFRFMGAYNLVWAKRAQPPEDHGCHMVSILSLLRLSNIPTLLHPNDEYVEVGWWSMGDIVSGPFHPALKRMVEDFMELILS